MDRVEKFPFYLRRSFYIHCALIALSLIGGKVILTQSQKLQNENLELIRASVRVDMVAMPTHTLQELKSLTAEDTPAPPEPMKEEIKKEEAAAAPVAEASVEAKEEIKIPGKGEAEDKRQNFLEKLKHLSGKKIVKKKEQTLSSDSQQLKQLVLAGNKLSKGTEAYGDSRGGNLTAFQAYISRLPQKVKPYWRLPTFLYEKKLKCRVRVWLAMDGQVKRAEIYQSSGDKEYDQKALEAVKLASPFPALSDEFGSRAINGEIVLGFPL